MNRPCIRIGLALALSPSLALAQLTPVEQDRLKQFKSTQLNEWTNADLAAYLDLRERDDSRPDPVHPLGATALKFVGTGLNAKTEPKTRASGKITPSIFLYKTVAMTYASNWDEFVAIMTIMQFRNGEARMVNAVDRDVLEWS